MSRAARLPLRAALGVLARGDPRAATARLLMVEQDLALQLDRVAIRYDGGVHAKHRLTGYHDFFVERIGAADRVLDVGCGKGELAHDIAERTGAEVVGIDVNAEYLRFARERFRRDNLTFVEQDALAGTPPGPFSVVVLSNVLEHIAPRVELLRRLREEAAPERVLIRVPVYERSWLVPLRAEVGLSPYGDATHEIEYRPGELEAEVELAGYALATCDVRWAELWADARPA